MTTLILFHNDWIEQKYDRAHTSSSIFITKISQTMNRIFHSLYSKIERLRAKTKKKKVSKMLNIDKNFRTRMNIQKNWAVSKNQRWIDKLVRIVDISWTMLQELRST